MYYLSSLTHDVKIYLYFYVLNFMICLDKNVSIICINNYVSHFIHCHCKTSNLKMFILFYLFFDVQYYFGYLKLK